MKNYLFKYLTLTLTVFILASVISCNKDETGPPEIHGVRITDPSRADSLFNQAYPGSMVVIVGKNLQKAKKVFINNQDVFFNANYNTSTHIIIDIPSEEDGFEIAYKVDPATGEIIRDPDISTEIRVETEKGIARFTFLVTYKAPSITRIDAETYPTPANNRMTVTGYNLVDIKKIFFTDVPQNLFTENSLQVEVFNYDLVNRRYLDPVDGYVTESLITFRLPNNLPRTEGNFFGYFVVDCQAAPAFIDYKTLPPPLIQSISSEMPFQGMKVTINGLYFFDVESVDFNNGEIIILPEDMETLTRDKIVFTMPAKISTSKVNLKITAMNGVAILNNLYQYENLFTDFDEVGKWESWSGDDVTFMEEAVPGEPPFTSDGGYGRINGLYGQTWWSGAMVFLKNDSREDNILPSFDGIPAKTPVKDIYLAYDCYNRFSFDKAPVYIQYKIERENDDEVGGKNVNYSNFNWDANATVDVSHPGIDGLPRYNEWYTVYIPLSKFIRTENDKIVYNFAELQYSDIVANHYDKLLFVTISPKGILNYKHEIDIFFDNIRFVTLPK